VPEPVRAGLVSVVGGESTGKSTLAMALGRRLPGLVVPEHLRTWVDQQGRVPRAGEQAAVMAAHREAEQTALREADRSGLHWVVSDSGPLMIAVYSIQYYDDSSLVPQALEWAAGTAGVVWCQDDFPWQPDRQRDGADARATSQQILARIFAEHPELPVLSAAGSFDERIDAVIGALDS
jgi:nicotinamide riboside kinase